MLLAHEERFRRIYADYRDRPCGDYAELLRRGEVISRDGVDVEAWRAEIRCWLRHDEEYISYCERCGARIYIRLAPPRTEDGEALADACPTGTS